MTAFAVCSSKLSFYKAECWNMIFYFLHQQQNPILCFVRISILSFLTKAGLKVQDKSWKNRNKCKCWRNWEVIQSKQKIKLKIKNQLFIQNEEMKLNSEWLNHQAHLKSYVGITGQFIFSSSLCNSGCHTDLAQNMRHMMCWSNEQKLIVALISHL